MTNELDLHPYRFLLLDDAFEASLSTDEVADFGSMSEVEFRCRIELIGIMKSMWCRWRSAGAEVFDFAPEMSVITGSQVVDIEGETARWLEGTIYVNFGKAAGLNVDGSDVWIDGAYLEPGDAAGAINVVFVCDAPRPPSQTLRTAMIAQSRIISAVLDTSDAKLSELTGDAEILDRAPIASLAASVMYGLSEMQCLSPADVLPSRTARSFLH
ncbi:hypothetical protein [Rhizobium sp. 2MFCol3.1]|uniref:hypothetical protein n=1 Tax=Rhizobium sp. 2MFCol3.1 TaxID=1246459 RepID=UPI00036BFD1C|nr:hypothetical protein [Rhizobium sp. 2MFCol3.1]